MSRTLGGGYASTATPTFNMNLDWLAVVLGMTATPWRWPAALHTMPDIGHEDATMMNVSRLGQDSERILRRFATKFLASELKAARKRWQQGLRRQEAWKILVITILSMYALCQWAFDQGVMFGLSFLVAAILSTLRGHVFTHPLRLFLVAIATVIGALVIPDLRGDAWQALWQGDTLTAASLAGASIFFWQWKRQLETGSMGTVGVRASKLRRRSGRR